MKRMLLIGLVLMLGCTPVEDPGEDTTTSSDGSGGSGGSGGSETSSSGGSSGGSQATGGSAGEGGEVSTEGSTDSGGSAGETNTEGSGGSETSSGGASGSTGGSSGVGGSDAGGSSAGGAGGSSANTGGSGTTGFEVLGELDPIIGPAEGDPGYIEVTSPLIDNFRCYVSVGHCNILRDDEGSFIYNGGLGYWPTGIVKRDENFEVVWAREMDDLNFEDYTSVEVTTIDVNPAGEILFAGEPRRDVLENTDVVVGKLDPDGNLLWHHVWGSNGGEAARFVSYASDGSFLLLADSTGQAPGNPPTNAGHPVLAWFTPDNERQSLYQVSYTLPITSSPTLLHNDGSNYSFVENRNGEGYDLVKTTPDGTEVAKLVLPEEVFTPHVNPPDQLAFNPTQDIIYALGGLPPFNETTGWHQYSLAAFALDGTLLWYRKAYPSGLRTQVIDEVEGTYWSGSFYSSFKDLKVTENSIIVSGSYVNTYTFGSNPPPEYKATFVARYDLTGELIWFQQYLPEGFDPESLDRNEPTALVIDNGGILLFMGDSENARLVRIDLEDGSVIE